jgi:hypothetical protein
LVAAGADEPGSAAGCGSSNQLARVTGRFGAGGGAAGGTETGVAGRAVGAGADAADTGVAPDVGAGADGAAGTPKGRVAGGAVTGSIRSKCEYP